MSRLQLALNVSNLEAAIAFYARLFDSSPAKVRPGYANFAIADPPLKLVLIECPQGRGRRRGVSGALNHLGVEVEESQEIAQAGNRLAAGAVATTAEHGTSCCYAVQDKLWTEDPDATPWEVYMVLADVPAGDGQGINGGEAGRELNDDSFASMSACC